jgi:hypothetical protein
MSKSFLFRSTSSSAWWICPGPLYQQDPIDNESSQNKWQGWLFFTGKVFINMLWHKSHEAHLTSIDPLAHARPPDGLREGASLSDCGTFVEVNWETGKQFHVILFVRGYSLQQLRRGYGNRHLLFWTHWWRHPTSDLMMPSKVRCPKPRITYNNTQ